jgi:hypothetical protein
MEHIAIGSEIPKDSHYGRVISARPCAGSAQKHKFGGDAKVSGRIRKYLTLNRLGYVPYETVQMDDRLLW